MADDHEDVLIVDVRDHDEPVERDDRYRGLFHIPFLLSPEPPPGWEGIFDDDRMGNSDSALRENPIALAYDELVALSTQEKVEKVYDQMREHVTRSNARYRQQNGLPPASPADKQRADDADRRVREILRNLKFA